MSSKALSMSAIISPVIALTLGWVLGASSQTPPSVTHNEIMKTQLEIVQLLRAQRDAYLAANAELPVGIEEVQRIPQRERVAFDFVLWEAEMQNSLIRLQDRMQLIDPSYEDSYASTLRAARNPNAPHNEKGLYLLFDALYMGEEEDSKRDDNLTPNWEAAAMQYLYRPMQELLYEFGKPDRIEHYEGGTTWSYKRTLRASNGDLIAWKLNCEFWGTTLVDLISEYHNP